GKAGACPGGVGCIDIIGARQTIELQARQASDLQNTADFTQILVHDFAARDVLEDCVRINKFERLVFELGNAGSVGGVRIGVGNVSQFFAGARDHFIGDIHAVNLREVAAHGAHEPSWSTTDFECAP